MSLDRKDENNPLAIGMMNDGGNFRYVFGENGVGTAPRPQLMENDGNKEDDEEESEEEEEPEGEEDAEGDDESDEEEEKKVKPKIKRPKKKPVALKRLDPGEKKDRLYLIFLNSITPKQFETEKKAKADARKSPAPMVIAVGEADAKRPVAKRARIEGSVGRLDSSLILSTLALSSNNELPVNDKRSSANKKAAEKAEEFARQQKQLKTYATEYVVRATEEKKAADAMLKQKRETESKEKEIKKKKQDKDKDEDLEARKDFKKLQNKELARLRMLQRKIRSAELIATNTVPSAGVRILLPGQAPPQHPHVNDPLDAPIVSIPFLELLKMRRAQKELDELKAKIAARDKMVG